MTKSSKPIPAGPGLISFMYQLLETEMGGVQIYRTALQCAQHPELVSEWSKYLAQTERHVVIARALVEKLGLDPDAQVPARLVCRHMADGLINVMLEALSTATADDAELTAAECVVHAETKDHANWELVGSLAEHADGSLGEALSAAYAAVEPDEDRHLYHTKGWTRELWKRALGLAAMLPPPEEKRDVTTAIEAAKAKQAAETRPS
jgi:hypothetical protein